MFAMQDTTTDFAPVSGNDKAVSGHDTAQSRNLAAIALAEAINRARQQQGTQPALVQDERSSALIRLRGLRRKLVPLYAAIPQDVELFDLGFVTEEKPRLFVDIIAFVEMGGDLGHYRFMQETRSGRNVMLETDDETLLIARITDYIARRLIDREKAIETAANADSATHDMLLPVPVVPKSRPEPRPEPSMTAAEAFRQWSSAGKAAVSDTVVSRSASPAEPVAIVDPVATVTSKDDPHPVRTADPARAAIESAASSISEAAQAIRSREASAAAPIPAATPVLQPMAAAIAPRSNAWWLWPLIALLLGIGLGIAALYAYAASLTR
jgi:hypothetical protein